MRHVALRDRARPHCVYGATVARDGSYDLPAVVAGVYEVRLDGAPSEFGLDPQWLPGAPTAPVALAPGDDRTLAIVRATGGTATGRVDLPPGFGRDNVQIVATATGNGPRHQVTALLDARGRFALRELMPHRTYRARVTYVDPDRTAWDGPWFASPRAMPSEAGAAVFRIGLGRTRRLGTARVDTAAWAGDAQGTVIAAAVRGLVSALSWVWSWGLLP